MYNYKKCRQHFGSFEDAKKFLRLNFSLNRSVRITRVPLDDVAGDCDLRRGGFRIRVDKDLCVDTAILILFHEWAHALSWKDSRRVDHGQMWGKTYCKIWSEWSGDP